jgi:hypothetical protein
VTSSAMVGRVRPAVLSPVAVNPHGGFNCYWPMPFRQGARLSLENTATAPSGSTPGHLLHRRAGGGQLSARPVAPEQPHRGRGPHVLLDGVIAGATTSGPTWPGACTAAAGGAEGEVKFYLDDDEEFPTICGTGTEDYFGGAWNFDVPGQGYTRTARPISACTRSSVPMASTPASSGSACTAAHPGPDHFRLAAARRRTSPRLAQRRPLPSAPRRHRLDGVLLSGRPGDHTARRSRPRTRWRSAEAVR